jgi:hypothetical protein
MALLLVVSLLFATAIQAVGQATVRVYVNGEQVMFDQQPIVVGSRVLVPLRGIFEKMGATVVWLPETRTVRAQRGTTSVELHIGSTSALVNGATVTLDVPAQIVGGRTVVPLRFISESLGATVNYDDASRTVTITTTSAGPPPPPPPGPGPTQITLVIDKPVAGDDVSNPVRVKGKTAPGATLVVNVLLEGNRVGHKEITVDSTGQFDTRVQFTITKRDTTYHVLIKASKENMGTVEKRIPVRVR